MASFTTEFVKDALRAAIKDNMDKFIDNLAVDVMNRLKVTTPEAPKDESKDKSKDKKKEKKHKESKVEKPKEEAKPKEEPKAKGKGKTKDAKLADLIDKIKDKEKFYNLGTGRPCAHTPANSAKLLFATIGKYKVCGTKEELAKAQAELGGKVEELAKKTKEKKPKKEKKAKKPKDEEEDESSVDATDATDASDSGESDADSGSDDDDTDTDEAIKVTTPEAPKEAKPKEDKPKEKPKEEPNNKEPPKEKKELLTVVKDKQGRTRCGDGEFKAYIVDSATRKITSKVDPKDETKSVPITDDDRAKLKKAGLM
jgi:hypothetical protein